MWTVFAMLLACVVGWCTVKFCRSSVWFYREIMQQRRDRERRAKERTVWRAHVAIVNTEHGRDVTLPAEEWDALMQRLRDNRCMIIPTDDEIGIVMYGRNVYPDGLSPSKTLEIPW